MERGLYEELTRYGTEEILPMHMPGHKRNKKFNMGNPYEIDVTEVDGMDDLHHPQGVIRRLMNRIQRMYGSEASYLLVNGSTGGILSAITACCKRGDRILVARNCHKSVYNAIRLLELHPLYVVPGSEGGDREGLGIAGAVRSQELEKVLAKEPGIACVVLTSPTYEGVLSPIGEIAEVVHRYRIPLVVDEAHGAHFHWHPNFPKTALEQGADIVIESLHKTLPALTQTGVLHVRGDRVNREQLEWCLQTYQTSSPSYVLMAGIDRCISYMEREGKEACENYWDNMNVFLEKMKSLRHLYVWDSEQKEKSKLVLATNRSTMTGDELAEALRQQYRIETEMSAGDYCIAMTSIADEKESFDRLAEALMELDKKAEQRPAEAGRVQSLWQIPKRRYDSYEVAGRKKKRVMLSQAAGCVAAENIYRYPPGIPLVVQGEIFSEEAVALLMEGENSGIRTQGIKDGMVAVVVEDERQQ